MSLLHRISHFIYPRGSVRQVLRGPLRGMRFHVVNGMGATYALGMDFMNLKFLSSKLKPGMEIFDVGANCGQMALFFSRQIGAEGRIISFEPVAQNAVALRKNLALNGCGNVEVVEAAVAADELPKTFCFDSAHHTMGTLAGSMVKLDSWDTTLQVPCVTLDGVVERGAKPAQVLKIDVEGAGLGVIEGAVKLIETEGPAIYFELHATDEYAPELLALRLLRERWNYRITDVEGTLGGPYGKMWGGAAWCVPASGWPR